MQEFIDEWLSKEQQEYFLDRYNNLEDKSGYENAEQYLFKKAKREKKKRKCKLINEYCEKEIKKEMKGDKYLHFSEYERDYQRNCFYQIFEKEGEKYIAFETSSYKMPFENEFVILDYNYVFDFLGLDRNGYFGKIIDVLTEEPELDKDLENSIPLKEFIKFDISYGLKQMSRPEIYEPDAEELFYNNDLLLYNKGRGRKLLDIEEITLDTSVGEYFSNETILINSEHKGASTLEDLLS